jgi:predicted membrane-bound spermidine synthase
MDEPSLVRAGAFRLERLMIYVVSFVVSGVLMGFEMVSGRLLYPYFGSGTDTWAALISVTLCALAIGAMAGGRLIDRRPSTAPLSVMIGLASIYFSWLPVIADSALGPIAARFGEGPAAVLLGACALVLTPVTLLGTLAPAAMRLLVRSPKSAGTVAGTVSGISTVGSVVGTLVTAFILIPAVGSRRITVVFTVLLAACAVSLFLMARDRRT